MCFAEETESTYYPIDYAGHRRVNENIVLSDPSAATQGDVVSVYPIILMNAPARRAVRSLLPLKLSRTVVLSTVMM